ncbi:MAG: hypothetical protein EKK61_01220 [Rickettsiales bacterium]|nr:MAG: hypothetical protein EKK61_01220 [Rickettsiales bacterium]
MDKIKNFALFLTLIITACFSINNIHADEDKKHDEAPKAKLRDPAQFQKVIDEYKDYLATVPVEIREEIVAFRKETARLNKEKKELYKKLSQGSQNYLKKEQQYKKKLPLNRKSLITIDELKHNADQEKIKKAAEEKAQ